MYTHIGRRLSPSEKNWRKLLKVFLKFYVFIKNVILKTLNLVEALLVFGNPECIDHFYENIDTFKYAINFDFVEEVTGNHGKSGLCFF